MEAMKKVIILIETSWAYGRGLLRGIAKYSRINSNWLVHREYRMLENVVGEFEKIEADGMIVRGSADPRLRKLLASGVPSVVVHYNKEFAGMPTVSTDNESIGTIAAQHLMDRGFTNFAFCGYDNMSWSIERGEAFASRVSSNGTCHFFEQPHAGDQFIWENELPLLIDWIKALPKPIGIMGCNDDRAENVMEACKLAQIDIPEQVALIGVDDDEFVCDLSNPSLTSVALNTDRAGYQVAELLDNMMRGRDFENESVVVEATHVVTRQSTNILAVADSDVAASLRYIREHSRQPLQVSDVVDSVMISRRNLQQKFNTVLGKTIYDEIRKARTEQIAELLINTSMSVSRIAHELGFPGIEHVSRYFKQEKGISPQAYRKKNGQF